MHLVSVLVCLMLMRLLQYTLPITPTALVSSIFAQETSLEELRTSPEESEAEAQYKFGMMYLNGERKLKDSVMAYAWLNVAGANGNLNALENKSKLGLARETKHIAEALCSQIVKDNPKLLND